MGRMATPEEIAYTVAFYCSDAAAYITGSFILQDGGLRDHSVDRASELDEIAKSRTELSGVQLLSKIDSEDEKKRQDAKKDRELFGVK